MVSGMPFVSGGGRVEEEPVPPRSVADQVATIGIEAYLAEHQRKERLRFLTCGSVDDGKSTLIGRLLYEAQVVLDDQLLAWRGEAKTEGWEPGPLDFSALLDGLVAEREQGITIDVAYRYFTTATRSFIVADAPGHEQYTRNMVTAASTADLAVVLLDARQGIVAQTRRHSFVVALMGIRQVIVAVNKMDLVGYDAAVFASHEADYQALARELGLTTVTYIPISALHGDNLTTTSSKMPWYRGPDVLRALHEAVVGDGAGEGPFRMPVQQVIHPGADFRGFAGTVVRGQARPGDRVRVWPSGVQSTVARIVSPEGDLASAESGQAVTLTLADEVDVSRGDVLTDVEVPPTVSDQFEAHLVWLHPQALLPGRRYLLKLGAKTVNATVSRPKYKVSVESFEHVAASTLGLNEIGVVNVSVDRPIVFDPYVQSRDLGGFLLIERFSLETVGAGMVHFGLRRADNLHWQHVEVDAAAHSALNGHRPAVVWLTGLSGAGKSTIANIVEQKLHVRGVHTFLLDGDNVRHGLNRDLGFTDADRVENIRRVGEVCHLMTQAGLVVIAAFISPFDAERQMVRDLVQEGTFVEVFVDAPLAVAEARDPKGLYAKARRGELVNFTGVDSRYEPPAHPEIHIDTTASSVEDAADRIIDHLRLAGVLPGH